MATFGPLFRLDSIFFFTLPNWLTYGIVALLQRFIAGYFTYRLCRDYLRLGELPSVVAGLAYSLSLFWFQSEFIGQAGFPLVLWALEYIHERRSVIKYSLAFLLGLFVLFSSSFFLSIPFLLILVLCWFVLVRRKYSLRFLSIFAVFSLTLLLGQIPTIWALWVNGQLSHRASGQWTGFMGPFASAWLDWVYFSWQSLWFNVGGDPRYPAISGWIIGPWVLCLGVIGLWISKFKERSLIMVMALLLFCAALSPLLTRLVSLFDQYLGPLAGFNFGRFVLFTAFFAAIAGAYGLHLLGAARSSVRDNPPKGMRYSLQVVLCIITVGILISGSLGMKYDHFRSEWLTGSRYSTMYENPELQHLAATADSDPFRVATVAYNLHPAYANAYGLETVDGYVGLYPQRYQDFWGKVIEPLTIEDKSRYDVFHLWGNTIYLFSPSNGDFDCIGEVPFSEYYNLNLLALANAKYIISELPLSNEHLTLLPSYTPDTEGGQVGLLQRIKERLEGRRDIYIYENQLCFPRFFMAGKAEVFDGSSELLEAMADADVDSLRNTVFVEEKFISDTDVEQLGFAQGEITIERYSPDRIDLSVSLDKPGILVISNSYSPYWTCKVNGVDQDIFPAYHTFWGVLLEEGESMIELEYSPPYWTFW